MTDAPEPASSGRAIIIMMLSAVGIIFTAGAIAGFLDAHQDGGGGPMTPAAFGILALFGAIMLGLIVIIWKQVRKLRRQGEYPLTRRERLNRNIVLAFLAIGAVAGVAIATADTTGLGDGNAFVLSSAPMEGWLALLLLFFWIVLMPVASWYWHTRAIDEHEASAYRDGAFFAAYAYMFGAPAWWLLWRGGFVAEPDGVAIFTLFAMIWAATWFWKKYV